ncbi:MAG: CRISPR-associated protein Csx16 [Acidiferrobacterales bacterium]
MPGTRDWAAAESFTVDEFIAHFDVTRAHDGDAVIGSLPVNLATGVCAHGVHYLNLSFHLPVEARGVERLNRIEGTQSR